MSPSVVRDTWGFICVQEIHRGDNGQHLYSPAENAEVFKSGVG